MRIKLFTHTDLDGVGCVIVAHAAFGKENVDFELCNYGEIDNKVAAYLDTRMEHDLVFITDISVKEPVAQAIDLVSKHSNAPKFRLFDHHDSAKWLNKYDWAYVNELELYPVGYPGTYKTSGTDLFYIHLYRQDYLPRPNHRESINGLSAFVHHVNSYDSWEWATSQNMTAKRLNDLLYTIGQSKFIQRFTENPDPIFTEAEQIILEIEEARINKYINSKEKTMKETLINTGIKPYKAGVVFAESYISELGNELSKRHPNLDFIAIIDPSINRVSYRTIHDHINVGDIAICYGGGGHPKSSGSLYDPDLSISWINEVFEDWKVIP
jgi:oligoribonuclease NrnB/cAMP/cGMP phosphodiesterase (DHH superfamily)